MTHLLIPLHPKIRMSFPGLRRLATKVLIESAREIRKLIKPVSANDFPKFIYQTQIQRSTDYIEDLIYDKNSLSPDKLNEALSNILFSRYLGVIRIECDPVGTFDLLVDTTSTMRNLKYLGIIFRGQPQVHSEHFAKWLGKICNCKSIIENL